MSFTARPVTALHGLALAALLVAATLLTAPAAQADAWQGPGVKLQINPQQPSQARLSLNGQTVPASARRSADGSITGQFSFGQDQHTYTLSAPGPNGQRSFQVGQHTATLAPIRAAASGQTGTSSTPAGALRLKQHTFKDPGPGSMPTHTVLVPEGWNVEGGGWFANPTFYNVLPSHNITVTAPDGAKVELSPDLNFKFFRANPNLGFHIPPQREGQADSGYPVMEMPVGPQGYAHWIQTRGMPETYPDATNVRVLEVVPVPELYPAIQQIVGPMQRNAAQQNQQNQQYGMPGGSFADGAYYAAHVSFDRNGRSWEQLSIVGVYWLRSDYEVGRELWWGTLGTRTFTVPAGELQQRMPTLIAIADSARVTPQWSRMKNEHAAKLRGIAAQGAADIAEINRQGWEKVRQINQQTSDIIVGNTSYKASDNAHRKYINSIHEVDDYADPTTGSTVQLPSGYSNVYSNGNNEYLLTNDVLTDPNTLGAGNWTQVHARP